MQRFWILVLILLGGMGSIHANEEGYRIAIEIDGFENDTLILGYFYGKNQYARDTVIRTEGSEYVFEGAEPLEDGVYFILMPPENQFFQFLFTKDEPNFKIKTSYAAPSEDLAFEGSQQNALFQEYLKYLNSQGKVLQDLKQKLERTTDEAVRDKLIKQEQDLNAAVLKYQKDFVEKHKGSLVSAMVKANLAIDYPKFEGNEQDLMVKRWRYTQKHYFDNLDLHDQRLLYTPFLFKRVDHYINNIAVQHPDSIAQALDTILNRMRPAKATFKYYLVHYLNTYAASNIVGMDAVYVHLVDNYYAKGDADWTDEEQLDKIIENAKALKPILIGKQAPNLNMQKRDGSKISLYDVKADITILYFWRYDCGHCKKQTPKMKEFYDKVKDVKDIKIFSICTKLQDEVKGCWDYIDDNAIQDWIHTVDPYHRSKYFDLYNIKSTPQIFILDEKKEIIFKRIGAEQLEQVIDRIYEMREKETK